MFGFKKKEKEPLLIKAKDVFSLIKSDYDEDIPFLLMEFKMNGKLHTIGSDGEAKIYFYFDGKEYNTYREFSQDVRINGVKLSESDAIIEVVNAWIVEGEPLIETPWKDGRLKELAVNNSGGGANDYSWKFWVLVCIMISGIVVVLLCAGLSIKAIVQDIQLIAYENKAEGVVTVAEYYGARNDGDSTKYAVVHYIITFDEETAGYSKYEYSAENIGTTKKHVGHRYVVLFNDIEDPVLIQKDDILVDNIALAIFLVFTITTLLFRRKILRWLVKISDKLNDMCLK